MATLLAGTLMLAGAAPAAAEDIYLAVNAPPGLTVYFGVNGGSKSAAVDLFHTPGDGITKHNADGWYVQKLPAGFDTSKMKRWCVIVLEPQEYFDEGTCSRWGSHEVPDDGIFKLRLRL